MKHNPTFTPAEAGSLAIDLLSGLQPDCTLYTAADWITAARQWLDGDTPDLENYIAETQLVHDGLWIDEDAGWRLSNHAVNAGLCEGFGA